MDGAPLAMMLARRATIDLAESGGPFGPTRPEVAPRRHRRPRAGRAALARTLRRIADALQGEEREGAMCTPAH